MSQSQKMRNALSKFVIPNLVEKGFVGEYPHYKRIFDNRIELLAFLPNKWGNSFTVEISTVFFPESKRNSNFCHSDFKSFENVTVCDTNLRYRLKGLYDGWFYYTDVYKQKIIDHTFYNAVSEKKSKDYIPAKNEVLVQKANNETYRKVCVEVNKQMAVAFKWWDAFNKNHSIKMKLLDFFN